MLSELPPGEDFEDREYPDDEDPDVDGTPLGVCRDCGADVYMDAPSCPRCGGYRIHSGPPPPLWWWLGLVAALAASAMLLWM